MLKEGDKAKIILLIDKSVLEPTSNLTKAVKIKDLPPVHIPYSVLFGYSLINNHITG